MNKIDVYDFDGTIYNGDCSVDFFLYLIRKKKRLIKYLPKIILYMTLNKLGRVSTKKFKETFFSCIKEVENINETVERFWEKNECKINDFFLKNINDNKKKYVISASPEFLLKPYLARFDNVELIATKVGKDGKITGENCKGKEKVRLLNKAEKDFYIDNMYTDSISDLPLIEISNNAYLVHNGKVKKWNKNKT